MKILLKIGIAILVIFDNLSLIKGKCPKSKILYPCKCTNDNFFCGGHVEYDINKRFETVSNTLIEGNKTFNQLKIANTGITELGDNEFSDLKFKKLVIQNAKNLVTISQLAFNGTSQTIEEFTLKDAPNLSQDRKDVNQLFDALSSLKNAFSIELINTNLIDIPEYAFHKNISNLITLKFLNQNRTLRSIGNNAFYNLNNVQTQSLSIFLNNNSIDYLPTHAFDFETQSNGILSINLSFNRLNSSSFDVGVFTNSKSPLLINLSNNNITFLNESIFAPILDIDNNTSINVVYNPIIFSDCHMYWLLKNRSKYMNQVWGLNLDIDFWAQNLSHCEPEIPSTASQVFSTPTERTTEVSSTPTERTTEVSSTPTERTTEVSSTPTERTTEASSTPTEKTIEVSSTPTERTTEVFSTPTERTTEASSTPTEKTIEVSSTPTERTTEVFSTPTEKTTEVSSTPTMSSTPTERTTEVSSTPTERTTEVFLSTTDKTIERNANYSDLNVDKSNETHIIPSIRPQLLNNDTINGTFTSINNPLQPIYLLNILYPLGLFTPPLIQININPVLNVHQFEAKNASLVYTNSSDSIK